MPSTTFFNLPPEKREKLLRAARQEFARVPFSEASINKIIHAAEIPRGSFYVYFTDKEDLFRYLLSLYYDRAGNLLLQLLTQADGDLFDAFLALFDWAILRLKSPPPNCNVPESAAFFRNNLGQSAQLFLPADHVRALLTRLLPHVDTGRLAPEGEEQLTRLFELLFCITCPLIARGLAAEDPAAVRQRLLDYLSLLQRGACRPAADLPS